MEQEPGAQHCSWYRVSIQQSAIWSSFSYGMLILVWETYSKHGSKCIYNTSHIIIQGRKAKQEQELGGRWLHGIGLLEKGRWLKWGSGSYGWLPEESFGQRKRKIYLTVLSEDIHIGEQSGRPIWLEQSNETVRP